MVKKGTSPTKKNLKRRKKIVPPSKTVEFLFYHPDSRINFFSVDFLLKPLVKQKKLTQYIYTSSGNDWQGNFSREHKLTVYEKEIFVAVEILKTDGWRFINPYLENYKKIN